MTRLTSKHTEENNLESNLKKTYSRSDGRLFFMVIICNQINCFNMYTCK